MKQEDTMNRFESFPGIVYILENTTVDQVKVGMTTNRIIDRLTAINDLWSGRTITCQICGGRLVNIKGRTPLHVVSGIPCPGGNALPLERDTTIARSHLLKLKSKLPDLSGTEKGSAVRRINTLEKRIGLYQDYLRTNGFWQVHATFHTQQPVEVEALSHRILSKHLDKRAPFGEVFSCSVAIAVDAVQEALSMLGLLGSARKKSEQ